MIKLSSSKFNTTCDTLYYLELMAKIYDFCGVSLSPMFIFSLTFFLSFCLFYS